VLTEHDRHAGAAWFNLFSTVQEEQVVSLRFDHCADGAFTYLLTVEVVVLEKSLKVLENKAGP